VKSPHSREASSAGLFQYSNSSENNSSNKHMTESYKNPDSEDKNAG
jgi:hypothetical protein